MKYSTTAIFGKRAVHDISAYDYIEWAEEMLMQDYDSSSLRILAGLDHHNDFWEVDDYFLRSIKELDLEEPEAKTAIRTYACETAQSIIDSQLTPSRSPLTSSQLGVMALSNIYYRFLWGELDGNYSDYEIWLELNDALGSLFAGFLSMTLEKFDAIVKQEAEIFLSKMASYN
jgi:hypothetical protein